MASLKKLLQNEKEQIVAIKCTLNQSENELRELMDIRIEGPELKKSAICMPILRALPGWFGIEESLLKYATEIEALPTFLAYQGTLVVGFVSVKLHNRYSAEIYVLGVVPELHRQGIGRLLMAEVLAWLLQQGVEYVQVKTLGPSHSDVGYAETRAFYESLEFRYLEEFKQIWDENNPCLIMIRRL